MSGPLLYDLTGIGSAADNERCLGDARLFLAVPAGRGGVSSAP
jgi:hypothetical protein